MGLKVDETRRIPDAPIISDGVGSGSVISSPGRSRIGTITVAPSNVLSSGTGAGGLSRGIVGPEVDRRDNPPNPFDIAGDFLPSALPSLMWQMRRINELYGKQDKQPVKAPTIREVPTVAAAQQQAEAAERQRVRRGPVSADAGPFLNSNSTGQKEKKPMSILTTLGDVAGDYFKYKYGAPAIAASRPIGWSPAPTVTSAFSPDPLSPLNLFDDGVQSMSCGTGCDAPRYMKYDCKTGDLKPLKRRRRRPALTPTQLSQLTQIGTLKNNELVKVAIAKMLK